MPGPGSSLGSHTVVVSLGSLSLNYVLLQELGDFLGVCNLLLELFAASLQVAVTLEVLADFGARSNEDMRIA
jgi:hypothetical protein